MNALYYFFYFDGGTFLIISKKNSNISFLVEQGRRAEDSASKAGTNQ